MTKPNLGKFGVFGHHDLWRQVSPKQLQEIESLGYGAIWAGGSPAADLSWVDPILDATTTLQLATGIVNIWTADAGPVSESFHRIDKASRTLPAGHRRRPPRGGHAYKKPYDALTEYLDALDQHGVPEVAASSRRWARRCSSCPPVAAPVPTPT